MIFRLAIIVAGILSCCLHCSGPARADQAGDVLHLLCGARGDAVAPLVRQQARRFLLHPVLLSKVVAAESGCRPDVVGARGELGLTQVTRQTAAAMGVDPDRLLEPEQNLEAGARYLARMILSCGGFVAGGLTRYSRGHGKCEASRYSRRVLKRTRARRS